MEGLLSKIGSGIEKVTSNPFVQGIGGALAFGANPLVGLLAANGIKNDRERRELQNDTLRSDLAADKARKDSLEELQGLLSSGQPQTPESQQQMLGLLSQINPQAVAQQLSSGLLRQPKERSEPPLVREIRALEDPSLSEDQKNILKKAISAKSTGMEGLQAAMLQIQLEKQQFELDKSRTKLANENNSNSQNRQFLEADINGTLSDAVKFLELNNSLENGFLQPGKPGSDLRRSVASIGTEIAGAFGADVSESQIDLDNLDKFNKSASSLGIQAISRMQNLGTITDSKFQAIQGSLASIGVNPAANRAIAADLIDEFLNIAQIEGIEVPNADSLRRRAAEARGQKTQQSGPRSVTLQDGTVINNVPENVTDEQVAEFLRQRNAGN